MAVTTKQSEAEQNPETAPEILRRRERVLALRAKLKPISQEDAIMIDKVIMEAREASIVRDPSA